MDSTTNRKAEEHPLATALRDHLKKLLDGPLTVKSARDVRRVVDSAMSLLMTFEGVEGQLEARRRPTPGGLGGYGGSTTDPYVAMPGAMAGPVEVEPVNGDQPLGGYTLPIVASSASENFGTTAIRELISAFASIRKAEIDAKTPSSEPTINELVEAMAVASNSGHGDLAQILEKAVKQRMGHVEEPVGASS